MATTSETPSKRKSEAGLFDLAMADVTTLDAMDPKCLESPEQAGEIIGGRYLLRSVLGEGGTG